MRRIYLSSYSLFVAVLLILFCTKSVAQTYCNPTITSSAGLTCANYCLRNVQIGGINNSPATTACTTSNYLTRIAYLSPGVAAPYSIQLGNWMSFAIYADFNNDGDFNDANELLVAAHPAWVTAIETATGNITVPATIPNGNYRMRVLAIWGNDAANPPVGAGQACATFNREGSGNYHDYTLNVSTCTGTPSAGTVSSSVATVCTATAFNLTSTSTAIGGGLSYNWQSSPTGIAGTYTTLGTTAAPSYTVASQTATRYYRAFAKCTSSGLSDTSNAVLVTSLCYCTPTITSSLACTNYNLRTVQIGGINNTPATTTCTTSNYLSLTATLTAGVAAPYSIRLGSWMSFAIYADFNNDGDFNDANEMLVANKPPWVVAIETVTGNVTVPATIPTGSYRMRVLAIWGNDAANPPVAAGQACATFNRDGSGNYHDYTLNVTGVATPVKLGDFLGKLEKDIVQLKWNTLTENNNKEFIVERSLSTTNFVGVATVASKAILGNSTANINYELADLKPLNGKAFYRLKQIDVDGKSSYSKIISITKLAGSNVGLTIYPNPAKEIININIAGQINGAATLIVTDIAGKKLLTQKVNSNTNTINVSNLPPGIYMLTYTDGTNKSFSKIIKE